MVWEGGREGCWRRCEKQEQVSEDCCKTSQRGVWGFGGRGGSRNGASCWQPYKQEMMGEAGNGGGAAYADVNVRPGGGGGGEWGNNAEECRKNAVTCRRAAQGVVHSRGLASTQVTRYTYPFAASPALMVHQQHYPPAPIPLQVVLLLLHCLLQPFTPCPLPIPWNQPLSSRPHTHLSLPSTHTPESTPPPPHPLGPTHLWHCRLVVTMAWWKARAGLLKKSGEANRLKGTYTQGVGGEGGQGGGRAGEGGFGKVGWGRSDG